MKVLSKNHFLKPLLFFLIAWGVLNLLQAFMTPLNNDEAYYWMYSKYLAWGYFDHPPMIALMIKTGYFIFHNELGVRLLVVMSQIVALLIIWELTDKENSRQEKNVFLFIIVAAILPVFNIYGFLATPDAPLILFTAVFLLAYRRFIKSENWSNTIFIALSMAALMYSKYHGALLIILVIISNPGLLKRPRFYVATIISVIIFIPHLLWQFSNDFPSLKYHLVERVSGFDAGNVPEYLLNLLAIHNPFILPVCIWLIFKNRAKNQFEKTLNYIFVGFLVFFFIESFRYHIEPQWTALICVPMIIILFNNIEYKSGPGSYIKWVAVFMLPVILFARFAFMVDFLPVAYLKREFHNNKKRAEEIGSLAASRPVVFTNSYQEPSEYTFYTGKFATSLNNLNYRKTQYDIWDFEEKIHGKEVLYVPHYLSDDLKEKLTRQILPDGDSVFVKVIKDFQSLQRECIILSDEKYSFTLNKVNTIHLRIFNPYPYNINLKHDELPVVFQIAFIKNGYREVKINLELPDNITSINIGDTISVDCRFTPEGFPSGIYKLGIGCETGFLYDTYNSKFKDVKIND
jgi:hypothetical protein